MLGIDISNYQGSPDFALVAASGVEFVIAKVSEGSTFHDSTYPRNRTQVPAHGMQSGGYHFLNATAAGPQADLFCSLVDPNALHALDVEAGSHVDVAGWVARYRTHFPAHPLVIYTGRDLWRNSTGGLNGPTFGPLWAAGYRANLYVPGSGSLASLFAKVGANMSSLPWYGWTGSSMSIMQFTAAASIPGISGGVDGDVFFGTPADWAILAGTHGKDIPEVVTDADKDDIATRAMVKLMNYEPPGTGLNLQTILTRTYSEQYVLQNLVTALGGDSVDVDALAKALAALLPTNLGIDPAVLASKITDELHKRLES